MHQGGGTDQSAPISRQGSSSTCTKVAAPISRQGNSSRQFLDMHQSGGTDQSVLLTCDFLIRVVLFRSAMPENAVRSAVCPQISAFEPI
jgi:hypothetical protein